MRRFGWIVLGLTLTACQAFRDAFTPHADNAARAAGQTLSAGRLAELAAGAERLPISQSTVSSLAYLWVDYALLAAALADDAPLADSATVLAAAWPAMSQLKWEEFHSRLVSGRIALSGRQVDSAFEAGTMRVFQHLLIRVPADAGTDVQREKRAQVERLLRQVRARTGANFGQLAYEHSDDPGSKRVGGYLGVSERGDPLVPEFKDAAWRLAPGELSDIVRSSYGFHLIRRPPLREIREGFHAGVEERLQMRFDSVYLDSLAQRRKVEVKGDAPAIARQAVLNLNAAWDDDRTLVSYRGGEFRVRDLVRWLHALDPQYAQGFANAGDEQVRDFLKLLTQRSLLIWQADSAGVTLGPTEWAHIRSAHDSTLKLLQSALHLSPEILTDSAEGQEARLRFAMLRVNDYLERVLSNRTQFLPVPPFLAATLRSRGEWEVSAAAVAQATSRAEALRASRDSLSGGTRGGGRQEQAPPLMPAPGPAPVPGGKDGGG